MMQLNMSWPIYSGKSWHIVCSLYLCPRNGADIPKRGRGVDLKVANLTRAGLRHGRNADILVMLSKHVCFNNLRKAFKVSP